MARRIGQNKQKKPSTTACTHQGCIALEHYAKGLCAAHYKAKWESVAKKTHKRKAQKLKAQARYSKTIKAAYASVQRWAKAKKKVSEVSFDDYVEFRKLPCHRCQKLILGAEMGFELIDKKAHLTLSNMKPTCRICKLINPDENFDPIKHARNILRRFWKRIPAASLALAMAHQPTTGKYLCADCNQEFARKQTQLDHITPVVDVNSGYIDLDTFARRLFCSSQNLQVLCKQCHSKKTKAENAIRKQQLRKPKQSEPISKKTSKRTNPKAA